MFTHLKINSRLALGFGTPQQAAALADVMSVFKLSHEASAAGAGCLSDTGCFTNGDAQGALRLIDIEAMPVSEEVGLIGPALQAAPGLRRTGQDLFRVQEHKPEPCRERSLRRMRRRAEMDDMTAH
jgi:hypothetical protein